MRDTITNLLLETKNKFTIHELEDKVMRQLGGIDKYERSGGYRGFFQAIQSLQDEGEITPLKANVENGKVPSLPLKWKKRIIEVSDTWGDLQFVRAEASNLNVGFYKRHQEMQTELEWEHIEAVLQFLPTRESREFVSKEERSYELFGQEKWLDKNEDGYKFLKRIGITLDDLYAKSYGEPFVFWQNPQSAAYKHALIVENLSAFHTIKRALNTFTHIYDIQVDVLIYGEGYHITRNLPFIDEIGSPEKIYYAGDLDPYGLSIFLDLCKKYPEYPILPAENLYRAMIRNHTRTTEANGEFIDSVLEDFISRLDTDEETNRAIRSLWGSKRRIPQEAVNFEKISKEYIHGYL
ncbi:MULTISPECIES: Wadjet anti-phage system protein JetD domain-containing protein [unclassified Paenibacillus]|uniref:Wadjet anti-phage system protein JetD domain-containing protein n=1 Tax=unclassified Paenibacillus TaxID=185978 RepID=UPI002783C4F6|nr:MULTISPECIES: Wadjet anti-phage system protein JetD domain-containing protein [unclassified Paenibacillus]MDQ0896313.1 hypothetical protein [Paenibacillus sp. V4I7]MDQ0913760.1 hypothetical protein [Paenibacillus sp. V4I5]